MPSAEPCPAPMPAPLARALALAWLRTAWPAAIAAVVAIALGIATWAAIEGLGDSAAAALQRAAAEGAAPSLVFTPHHAVPVQSVVGLSDPQVRAVLPRQFGEARVQRAGRDAGIELLGVELAKEVMARPALAAGARARGVAADRGILLDREFAAQLGAEPGDDVEVVTPVARRSLTLLATIDAGGDLGVVDLPVANQLFGSTDLQQAEILLAPNSDVDAIARRLGPRLEGAVRARDAHDANAVRRGAALRTTWRLGGLFALCLAAVALCASLVDLVASTRHERAQLRALGAAPALLRRVVALPAFVLAASAAGVGLWVGARLAPSLRRGCEAWLELQTGVRADLTPAPLGALTWVVVGCSGIVAALFSIWRASAEPVETAPAMREPGVDVAARAPRRLLLAALGFGLVLLLAGSPLVQQSGALRAFDLAAGIGATVLAVEPVACALMLFTLRCRAEVASAPMLLASGQLTRGDGGRLAAARLLTVAATMAVALLAIAESLQRAAPNLAAQRVPGDFVVTTVAHRLGFGGDGEVLAAALRAGAGVRVFRENTASGGFDVEVVAGTEAASLRRSLPPGAIVTAAADVRRRFVAAAGIAVGTVDTMVLLVLATTAVTACVLWWLRELQQRRRERSLEALGATLGHAIAARAWAGLWHGAAAGGISAAAGLLLGHAWTRGPLRSVLEWDCAFAASAEHTVVVAAGALLLTVAIGLLGAAIARRPLRTW